MFFQIVKQLPFIALLCAVAACSPIRYLSVDTYDPAAVTFPRNVRKIMVVNNTALSEIPAMPKIAKMVDAKTVPSDSVAAAFCRTLGGMIADAPCFDDVRLYEGMIRTDSFAGHDVGLTPEHVAFLCEAHSVDAIVSLDALLFTVDEAVRSNNSFGLFLESVVSGAIRIYMPGRQAPFGIVNMSDTLYSTILTDEPDVFTPDDVRYALIASFEQLAEKYHTCFVPHWSSDLRWYYIGSYSARYKEAAAFMATGKWEKAAALWDALYDAAASAQTKARLASNMALCSEMTGAFADAIAWAERACRHVEEHVPDRNERMLQLQTRYLSVLKGRIEAEKKLQQQIK